MIKILVVDDEKELCGYLKDFFTSRGYEVLTALNGRDAVSIVKKENPELVLLDITMPVMDGLETLRQIKNISPQAKVIMVTINDDNDTKQKAKDLGADEFVGKPFTTDYLENVVILKISEITRDKEPARFLIVDDEEDIRRSLRNFLSRHFECEIKEASGGKEAIDLLKRSRFDLVLLDIRMPGISGIDVIKEKKRLNYKPCIWAITGFDSEEVAHKVIEQGADDYIPKPFSLRVLDSKVRDFLVGIGKYKVKDSAGSER